METVEITANDKSFIPVNDLPCCLNTSKSIQFADDTSIYVSGKVIPIDR